MQMNDKYIMLRFRYKCRICGEIFDNLGTDLALPKSSIADERDLILYLNDNIPAIPLKFHKCGQQLGICDPISAYQLKKGY